MAANVFPLHQIRPISQIGQIRQTQPNPYPNNSRGSVTRPVRAEAAAV